MHPAQNYATQTSTQARSTTLRTYSPVALGATLLLTMSACSGAATTASPSATGIPSPSATSAKATPSLTRTATVTESTPTAGTVHTPTAAATVSPGTITTVSPVMTAQANAAASAKANISASEVAKASSTASLSSSDVQSAGGSCGSMDATGYLKHNATVQVASGAVDCLFARELIRQFVVQNPAEVTDKANGERTVMSARCYWKPGDGADRATPECVSLDGGSTVITVKLTN
ncbi:MULTISPECIES: hypothetical protein [unclassified Rothia (in: high G+C Gram-positive bacteria)]|uniref:hypothetical protein n=1 Tax=unclassified Rothia (in: high G+C Gram-positive bacteria) TaxID=2689056 RepID=UPI002447F0D0|nr:MULTISPECIES: hypothetical protein [Rothia]